MIADDITGEIAAKLEAEDMARLKSLATECPRPTIPDVLPFVRKLYDSFNGGAGCCLHAVLDDNNVRDDHIKGCIEESSCRGHDLCHGIALCLMKMSKTQRLKLSMSHGARR